MASQTPQSLQKLTFIMRVTGLVFALLGAVVYFDVASIGEAITKSDPELMKIFGGSLIFVGIVDIILVPRILEKILGANKK
ncbi:MAG: hypothetical protein JNK24_04645 [Alphaproteobacteria bacterium]|nr:hypothetical protein [Alphaproteobacteria bacterium]